MQKIQKPRDLAALPEPRLIWAASALTGWLVAAGLVIMGLSAGGIAVGGYLVAGIFP